jgi:hypothetical protein
LGLISPKPPPKGGFFKPFACGKSQAYFITARRSSAGFLLRPRVRIFSIRELIFGKFQGQNQGGGHGFVQGFLPRVSRLARLPPARPERGVSCELAQLDFALQLRYNQIIGTTKITQEAPNA